MNDAAISISSIACIVRHKFVQATYEVS